LHELAAEFKVSAERIRQIEAKALTKMKDVIAPA
jgi:RNA polymerase sigma-32 factor